MIGNTPKSPCLKCPVHLKKLSKLNIKNGCRYCRARLAYAAAVDNSVPLQSGFEAEGYYHVNTMYSSQRLQIETPAASQWKII